MHHSSSELVHGQPFFFFFAEILSSNKCVHFSCDLSVLKRFPGSIRFFTLPKCFPFFGPAKVVWRMRLLDKFQLERIFLCSGFCRPIKSDKIRRKISLRLGVVRAPEIECGPPGNGTKPIFIFISGIESYRSVKVAHIFGRTKKKKSFHSIRIDSIAARLSAVSLNQFEKSIKYFQVCASASFHRSTGG